MKILIACESSGAIRRALAAYGHNVISCDLLPSEDNSPKHYTGPVQDLLEYPQQWGQLDAYKVAA